jgi:polyphosphate glucokinase
MKSTTKEVDRSRPRITERDQRTILAIDVGGSHVKMMCSRGSEKRAFASGPDLTAAEMVARVRHLTSDWDYDVISIGYPGPVVNNRPLNERHNLGGGWFGFDFNKSFEKPVKIVNDATMQALGSYRGGCMLFLGLGTGLGSAMVVDGAPEPMELAHLPYKHGKTYEDYLGNRGRERLGGKKWGNEVAAVVARLTTGLEPDYVVIGGGNAPKLKQLPANARLGNNEDAFVGGFQLWASGKNRHINSMRSLPAS